MRHALVLLAFITTSAHAASFDCARASTPDERTVCADQPLSDLDSVLATAFNEAKQSAGADGQKAVIALARAFLRERQACGTDRSCIFGSSVAALVNYQNFGAKTPMPAWVTARAIVGDKTPSGSALPPKIGQCALTQVAGVTTRLDVGHPPKPEDFDSGTAVDFRNGGHQVSYDREPALLNSKPGDKVLMCLIAIPRDCPKGDDRGRIYTVTNTRTNETWTLPDSQHSCGGA